MNLKEYDLEIYTDTVIKKAISDYKNLCKINITYKNGKAYCIFKASRYPINIVMNEFDNYLIELMQ